VSIVIPCRHRARTASSQMPLASRYRFPRRLIHHSKKRRWSLLSQKTLSPRRRGRTWHAWWSPKEPVGGSFASHHSPFDVTYIQSACPDVRSVQYEEWDKVVVVNRTADRWRQLRCTFQGCPPCRVTMTRFVASAAVLDQSKFTIPCCL
jgi:hypothetical protein